VCLCKRERERENVCVEYMQSIPPKTLREFVCLSVCVSVRSVREFVRVYV